MKLCFLIVLIVSMTFLFILNNNKIVTKNDLTPKIEFNSESKLNYFQTNINQINEPKVTSNETNENKNQNKTTLNSKYNDFDVKSEDNQSLRITNDSTVLRIGGFGEKTMKIAITVCGNQTLRQSLMTIKSAIILTKSRLHFVIMTDEYNRRIMSRTVR